MITRAIFKDVNKFGLTVGLSESKARELNNDTLIREKRKEYMDEFNNFEDSLRIILYSKDPKAVALNLAKVPSDVLMAFFGIFGPMVIKVKTKADQGETFR